MKKFICLFCLSAFFTVILCGCKNNIDYAGYISELRYNVYLYSGDSEEIKVYCSQREVPYAADGIKGEINGLIEIYASFEKSYPSVTLDINGTGGEMSYMSVKNCWYISFSGEGYDADTLYASIDLGGNVCGYTLISVLSDGVMSCKQALYCVVEYNGNLFETMTSGGIFNGEIYVRLLYDDKCYYYVGICDRSGNIKAYLADGETGRIIAEHSSTA